MSILYTFVSEKSVTCVIRVYVCTTAHVFLAKTRRPRAFYGGTELKKNSYFFFESKKINFVFSILKHVQIYYVITTDTKRPRERSTAIQKVL